MGGTGWVRGGSLVRSIEYRSSGCCYKRRLRGNKRMRIEIAKYLHRFWTKTHIWVDKQTKGFDRRYRAESLEADQENGYKGKGKSARKV